MSYSPTDPAAFEERRTSMAAMLLPVVERMLEEETITEISVDRLIRRARQEGTGRISRSSFYNHFTDKGELLRLMAEDVLRSLFAGAQAWWTLGPEIDEERLLEAMRSIADQYEPHQKILGAVVEVSSYDHAVAETWTTLMRGAAEQVRQHVIAGQAAGVVSAEIDPDHDPIWISWMIERGLQQLVVTADPAGREQLLLTLRDILWRVLYRMET